MPKFKYVGDQPVDVPALGAVVKPGDVVDVDGVEGQPQWERVKNVKKSDANDSQEG